MVIQKIGSLDEHIKRIEDESVNIVLYCSEDYIRYMSVTLLSILENSAEENIYDILILVDRDIAVETVLKLDSIAGKYPNVSVRLINLENIRYLFENCRSKGYHISICFRLYVMTPVFSEYTKIITLDSDMICLRDLKTLYALEIEEYALAVSYEIDARWKVRSKYPVDSHYGIHGSRDYFYHYVKIEDVKNYFCTGIILWNLERVRRKNQLDNIIHELETKPYIFPDQDLLNRFYEKETLDIGLEWNHVNYELKDYEKYLSEEELKRFREQRKRKYVIHYAGHKPWNYETVEEGAYFWEYAVRTPWYTEICTSQRINIDSRERKGKVKKMVGKILPEGSLRKSFFRYLLTEFYRIKRVYGE